MLARFVQIFTLGFDDFEVDSNALGLEQALVIGSNIMLSPETSVLMANMNFLSPDGLCFRFEERANGYSRGEGVLAVVIKPLADALANGDVIRAVVRSTASNHDGRTPILTQPSSEAQEALIRDAYRKAGLGFERTRYVEAHGSSCSLTTWGTKNSVLTETVPFPQGREL